MSNLPVLPDTGASVSADDVLAIEQRIEHTIREVGDYDLLTEWRARAAALEAYLRGRDLQRPMLGAQRRVEARIGQLLGDAKVGSHHSVTTAGSEVAKDDRSDFRVLARALSGECDLGDDGWRKSRRALVSDVRQRLGLNPETPPLPDGEYRCIVADPPWKLDTGPDVFGGTGERGHDKLSYSTMTVEAIADLNVASLAATDAHLYLWTTNRYLRDAYRIAEAWGFRPSVLLTWAKPQHGVGLGDTFRLTTEFVLFARRGHLDHKRIVPTTWFDWPRSQHSVKPDAFYELVESVTPGPYVDLFARTSRSGWDVWGDEVSEVAS
jgi:N6-adenosine-specific RNA methylase IME4